ncbi:ribosome small subunit-dependent GTPase A [Myxococcota bacterium]|nr:ribosome small subunit-dependent GTPase A [Myxococcota bacterium]
MTRKGPVMFVEIDGERRPCTARGQGKGAVVGDDVTVDGEVVTGFAARRSELVRVDALGDRPHVIAANVDVMFIVCAVEPPLREGLIDRYLVAAHAARIAPVIVFNKTDLWLDDDPEDEEDFRERLSPYPPLGVPVIYTSAQENKGLAAVRKALKGRLGIFVGHSGVGKTSLLNALVPGLGHKTQELSEQSGRGRHTTTHTELFRVPGGGEVIDSPGIRAFGLWAIPPDQVRHHFVEFAKFAGQCRFMDCIHDREPGCAIKDAVEREVISPFRYEAYLRIKDSLGDDLP